MNENVLSSIDYCKQWFNVQNKYFVTWIQFHSGRDERKLTLVLESRNENKPGITLDITPISPMNREKV